MFAKRLKEKRNAFKLTQQELADAVGVSLSYLNKLENGFKPAPAGDVLTRLADKLNCTTDFLLGRD